MFCRLLLIILTQSVLNIDLTKKITGPTTGKTTNQNYINYLTEISSYFLKFASYGYCSLEKMEKNKCCDRFFNYQSPMDNWSKLSYGQSTKKFNELLPVFTDDKNTYAIFVNDVYKKIVITFPGTKDKFIQLGAEIVHSKLKEFSYKKYQNSTKISKYFGLRSESLIDKIFTTENKISMKLTSYQIIFTGHSLGGAMANAVAFFALDRGIITKEKNSPIIITYGAPRTGNKDFALTLMNNAELIIRTVNLDDLVTQIPPKLFGDTYWHTNGELLIGGDDDYYTINTYEFDFSNELNDKQKIPFGDSTNTNNDKVDDFIHMLEGYCTTLSFFPSPTIKNLCNVVLGVDVAKKLKYNIDRHLTYFKIKISSYCSDYMCEDKMGAKSFKDCQNLNAGGNYCCYSSDFEVCVPVENQLAFEMNLPDEINCFSNFTRVHLLNILFLVILIFI